MNKYVKEEPQMCKIVYICINKYDNAEVFFVCNRLHTLEYDEHIRAYKVPSQETNLVSLKLSDLYSIFPTILHTLNGNLCVSPK